MFNSVDEGREQQYLPKSEAAVYTDMSERTLERWIKQGRLEARTARVRGKRPLVMVSKQSLDAYRRVSTGTIPLIGQQDGITCITSALEAMGEASRLYIETAKTMVRALNEPSMGNNDDAIVTMFQMMNASSQRTAEAITNAVLGGYWLRPR